ncbi:MAG: alpha/beta fold hydrolase [Coriobacteriales bacterium]|nr:alpha/beta fold hydrolase [Coriobacteriales bacterium]
MAHISWENGYIRNDDAALYYEVHQSTQTDSPLLLLLHGNYEDMHVFDGHIEGLLPYYTVIAVDTRGHGKSSRGERPLSYGLFAEDLFTLANKLHIGTFLVLGFSDGANTAMEFALLHQERLAAMILVGGNISPDGLQPMFRKSLRLQSAGARLTGLMKRDAHGRKELIELMLKQPNIDPERLKTITVPTLIINGAKDVVLDEHSAQIASTLPNARRIVIPNAGHFVMSDAPEEFDRLVIEFLLEED